MKQQTTGWSPGFGRNNSFLPRSVSQTCLTHHKKREILSAPSAVSKVEVLCEKMKDTDAVSPKSLLKTKKLEQRRKDGHPAKHRNQQKCNMSSMKAVTAEYLWAGPEVSTTVELVLAWQCAAASVCVTVPARVAQLVNEEWAPTARKISIWAYSGPCAKQFSRKNGLLLGPKLNPAASLWPKRRLQ